ncbi:hypothetical protein BCV71DRAFT_257326 [Rhizopus microsporus]|uniref:Uncharacterized protein n=1 Tax=Rhizopus microsporus TaxID=58291 RepID=A0A1X0RTS7_RHIZD|nr:hypothetical protein BCV71DRAFT_257326 [Rhizopus microsporus]
MLIRDYQTVGEIQSLFYRNHEVAAPTTKTNRPQTLSPLNPLHVKRFKNSTIRIFSDNITAIKYVSKPGETASEHLQDMTIQLHELRNKYQLDPHSEIDHPTDKTEDKKLDFDRLEVIKRKREDGIAADTQDFLNQQIRPRTSRSYGYEWHVLLTSAITISRQSEQ